MNREELLKVHDELCGKAQALMEKKNHDYAGGSGESPFANFTRCEAMGICSTVSGFLVRMTDKLSRLSTYAESGRLLVKDEGVEDTCIDLINYSILLIGFLRDQKEKGSPRMDTSSVNIQRELTLLEELIYRQTGPQFLGWTSRVAAIRRVLEK